MQLAEQEAWAARVDPRPPTGVVAPHHGLSVLMSVYSGDRADYLQEALQSIWTHQTRRPEQIVLVVDGPVGKGLGQVISEWEQMLGAKLSLVRLEQNQGLAAALNAGLTHCRYELVARMDADDVALPERFASQVRFMADHPDVVAASAQVEEVDEGGRIIGVRSVPVQSDAIRHFAKMRNPLSHPVTIFRRSVVMALGGYPPLRKCQDYALWSLLLVSGHRLANEERILLRMRTGRGLLARRGLEYLQAELALLRFQRRIGFISPARFALNVPLRGVVRLPPLKLRQLMYRWLR